MMTTTSLGPINYDNYVDNAENVISSLVKSRKLLSTTKIRNILSLISELNDDLKRKDSIKSELRPRCNYIRMRFAYECGRSDEVKLFVERSRLLEILKEIKDVDDCQLFCNYVEALVAFHKYLEEKN